MKITIEQYHKIINKMQRSAYPGSIIKIVADQLCLLLLGKKSFGAPSYPATAPSPEVGLIAREIRKIKLELGALKLKQWKLKKRMLGTFSTLLIRRKALVLAKGLRPALARIDNLGKALNSVEMPDFSVDINGKRHYRNVSWEPSNKPNPIPGPPTVLSSYEQCQGYENWERPGRIEREAMQGKLTSYEKTGSSEQMRVSLDSADYLY
jgi:hypothetical protein